MSSKVVAKTSDKAIIRKRVDLSEVDFEPVIATGMISGVLSLLVVAMPLNLITDLSLGLSMLSGAGVAGVLTGGAFSFMYAYEVASESETYSSVDVPIWKTWAGVLLPFGQKYRIGTTKANLRKNIESIKDLEYSPTSVTKEVTHEISSRVKFTPLGAYVEQEFTASPVAMWDDAFTSTIDVHKFKAKV